MDDGMTLASIIDRVRARWLVVVAAALVGVALGAAYGYFTAPEPGYVATARVRAIAGSVPGVPTADTVIALAMTPGIQRSAAESAGLDPKVFAGSVEAAADPRDKTIALVQVTAAEREEAVEAAGALADAAMSEGLRPVWSFLDMQKTKVDALKSELELTTARIETLEGNLEAFSGVERLSVQESLQNNRIQRYELSQRIALEEYNLVRATETLVPLDAPEVTRATALPYIASNSLRGLLLGLVAGVLVAALGGKRVRAA